MTRKFRVEEPEGLTLKAYLTPNSTETEADASGYSLTEAADRQYEFTIPSTLVGLYRVVIEIVDDEITTSIDSGYVNILAQDGTYLMSNKVPTASAPAPSSEYSTHGPKRVKTREMEIEQFDPRTIQMVNERANNTNLPTFCGGGTCVGKHKCESRTNYAE